MSIEIERKMVLLAYIAYFNLGQRGYKFFKNWACGKVCTEIQEGLDDYRAELGVQEIVWGPTIDFPNFFAYANTTIFVCREKGSNDLTLVIRGTNPLSLKTWLRQDFAVGEMVNWDHSDPSKGKVSKGARRSLSESLEYVPTKSCFGGDHLHTYLERYFTKHPGATLRVTGHSLGGLLGPTLTLWMYERLPILQSIPIEIYSYAGPTAGDAAFAEYCATTLNNGTTTTLNRYVNLYDVAPRAWSAPLLKDFIDIYNPEVDSGFWDDFIIEQVIDFIDDEGYTQPGDEIVIPSSVKEGLLWSTLLTQIIYQHVAPYLYNWFEKERANKVLKEVFKSSISL